MTIRACAKLFALAALAAAALPFGVQAGPVSVGSDNSAIWTVSETHLDSQGNPVTTSLGQPQHVCLNAPTNPPNCPTGAMSYGYTLPGWTANLSSLPPNAKWIWASKKSDGTPITGATTGAANAEYSFKTIFFLCGDRPKDGTIWVAADNLVDVFVNGVSVIPPSTTVSHSAVTTVTVSSSILRASPNFNDIELKVKNGANPSDCGNDQYRCNPAGVVFGGNFADELSADPTCANPFGKVGDTRNLGVCTAPKLGSKGTTCICILNTARWQDWETCNTPPPALTCQDDPPSKSTYPEGTHQEPVACSTGQTGSRSRDCHNGMWVYSPGTCVAPPAPPITCPGISGPVAAGATEFLPCTPPKIGSPTPSRVCQSNGTFGPTSGICVLPTVGTGDICGNTTPIGDYTATCPSGTTCGPRTSTSGHKSFGCAVFGFQCPATIKSTDWYCDPP